MIQVRNKMQIEVEGGSGVGKGTNGMKILRRDVVTGGVYEE